MIAPQMENLLNYLSKEEGLDFHRNSKESDITSPYGIYKAVHKDAEVFKYLAKLTISLNVPRLSSEWNQSHLKIVNDFVNSSKIIKQEIKQLIADFYTQYYKGASLELMPPEAVIAVVSIYTLSSKKAMIAVQKSINEFITNGFIDNPILKEDGDFGAKSKEAMAKVLKLRNEHNEFAGYYFEEKVINNMQQQLDDLSYGNKEKFGVNRNGWRNRLERLSANK
jgi:hypothetical protein